MSEFLVWLAAEGEPLTLAEARSHCRIDADLTEEDGLIAQVLIPAARQLAESKTGAIIRASRWRYALPAFPVASQPLVLPHGLIGTVEKISYRAANGQHQDLSAYVVLRTVSDTRILPDAAVWPTGDQVEVIYTAGLSPTDFAQRYPGVRHWLLLAVGWAYAQRELFVSGKGGFSEMPVSYVDGLLAPLIVPLRF